MRISDWSSDVCSSDLSLVRNASGVAPPASSSSASVSRRPCQVAGASTGASACASKPWRSVSRCPVRLPLSTVDTYRSEEHTSELQSLMRISYAVFCLKKKKQKNSTHTNSYKKHTTVDI